MTAFSLDRFLKCYVIGCELIGDYCLALLASMNLEPEI